MVNSHSKAIGILFPNSYDPVVPELVSQRLMGSIPFASRYRLIDFILSSMVNCGIDNVSILTRKNYQSLMDHLGSGREWDLSRKKGGLNIFPPFAERTVKLYNGRVEALYGILPFLKAQKEKYVIISDTNIAVNFDFNAMIEAHIKSGADVTAAYKAEEVPSTMVDRDMYYTFTLGEGNRVSKIYMNPTTPGTHNLSMDIYLMDREFLINEINTAYVRGHIYFERDILATQLERMDVRGFEFNGYSARITDMKSYFDENMKLLKDENLDALFTPNPIYTKIRDDNPTRYIFGAKVNNIMAADGCVIEGEVENSILFRGVKVGKGAKVKNCVLMQDTVVEADASIEYMITDKKVVITSGKEIRGTDTFPVFASKGQVV